MPNILFIGTGNPAPAAFAAAIAAGAAPEGTGIFVAMCPEAPLPEAAARVMAGAGLDAAGAQRLAAEDAVKRTFDIVIAVSEEARERCPLMPGNPGVITWGAIPEPLSGGADGDSLASYMKTLEAAKHLVETFFSLGYFSTMLSIKRNLTTVLDNLPDGVITHDNNRKITHFNKAAEMITGYGAEEIIGRDCHDIFPSGFCGGKCNFTDCTAIPMFSHLNYSMDFTTKGGDERRIEMSVSPMSDDHGERAGVIATFKDMTRLLELETRLEEERAFAGIIGRDHKMQNIYRLIRDLSDSDAPVLILGETGTGKELVAAAVHAESRRAQRHFVPVNCGALPEGIIESELFGHVKGAFTGAIRDKKGRFEMADGGTIFLDEVGDLPPSIQVKLLRTLQEGTFERVGGERSVKVDVRVLSATNRDLKALMAKGEFREDLYYRLAVVPIMLPPLKDRRNDILLLAEFFLDKYTTEYGRAPVSISAECARALLDFDWPGNIRQLQNAMQFCLMKCKESVIRPEHLPPEILSSYIPSRSRAATGRRPKLDAESVRSAISQAGGNKVKAAKILGVGRATLYRFLDDNVIS